jgi:hypothetical protein
MSERVWLEWTGFAIGLVNLAVGRVSPRKMRLFAVACCRRIAHLLPSDERFRQGIDIAERYADRRVKRQELILAHAATEELCRPPFPEGSTCADGARTQAALAAHEVTHPTRPRFANSVTYHADLAVGYAALPASARLDDGAMHRNKALWTARGAESQEQCRLARDIFGNPYRPGAPLDRAILTWNGGVIPKMAQCLYEERTFDQLNVLADALEEATCRDNAILEHCRSAGPHARGCWAVDLVLGKR